MKTKIWIPLLSLLLTTACANESSDPKTPQNTVPGENGQNGQNNQNGNQNGQNNQNGEQNGQNNQNGNQNGQNNQNGEQNGKCDPNGRPYCKSNALITCNANGEAVSTPCPENCRDGKCVCNPNAVPYCKDNAAVVCGVKGDYVTTPCPENCKDGKCVCDPNTKPYCKDNMAVVCGTNGESVQTPCPETCIEGKCVCDPNTKPYCKDNTAIVCGTDGESVLTQCPDVCIDGRCVCDPNAKPYCKDNAVITCGSDGEAVSTTCPEACSDGRCVCDSNAKPYCKDNAVVTCGSNGESVSTPCPETCKDGRCVCDPNAKPYCKDNAVVTCGSNGESVSTPCTGVCSDGKCENNSKTADIAPSLASSDMMSILGPKIIDGGVNFAVYSEHATRIELLLFDNAKSDVPSMRLPLKKQNANVWTGFISGIGEGQHYGYIAFGPNWPYDSTFTPGSTKGYITDCDDKGNRYNPNKLLIDPYAKRLSGDMDITKGNPTTGNTHRGTSTWGAAPKSIVAVSGYQWSANETSWRSNRQKGDAFANHAVNDLVYYEVQPKGFTKSASEIKDLKLKITAPGTWRGIGQMAPYLKDLGINALELMPVAEKQDSDTYWGYNTINYFAPDINLSFDAASSSSTGAVMDEFKWMVDQLHQNDIELIIDVVYGQTGEGGIQKTRYKESVHPIDCQEADWAGFVYESDPSVAALYSFRGLDNIAYYLIEDFYNKRKQGGECKEYSIPSASYINQTGVGNQTRANYGPFKRLIFDSMHYWVEEMHVDGFRVDLASVLGVLESNKYSDTGAWFNDVKNSIVQEIIDDPVLQKYNTRIVAEPWDGTRYAIGGFLNAKNKSGYAWSEWNGKFRDMMKKFVNYDDFTLASAETVPPNWDKEINMGNLFTGSSALFDNGRSPYNSVNYLTAHDGFTLYDVVTYTEKLNGCGLLNPACCQDEDMCDLTSGSNDNCGRNWCNTGYFDDQTHRNDKGRCDNDGNEALKRQMIRNFFALLLLSNGTPMIYGGDELMRTLYGNNNTYGATSDNEYNWLRWNDWQNNDEAVRMRDFVKNVIQIRKNFRSAVAQKAFNYDNLVWRGPDGNQPDWGSKTIGLYYKQTGSTPPLFIMINMETNDKRTFVLPESGEWKVLVDTQQYFDDGIFGNDPNANRRKSHNADAGGLSHKANDSYELNPRTIVVISK